MVTFTEILKLRRSIRNFQDRQVPLDIIKELINESILAPNSGNDQPWKFIIVNNKGLLKRMSDESKKNMLARIVDNPNDRANNYKKVLRNESFNVFYNAPCLVIILGTKEFQNLYADCALAAGYFMMAATSRGLGTCWVNLGAQIRDPKLLHELGVPEDCQIVAPIVVGYPVKIPSVPKRREPEIIKIIT